MQNPLDEDDILDEAYDDSPDGTSMDIDHMSTELLWQLVHQPFPGNSRKAVYLNNIQHTMSQLLPNSQQQWFSDHQQSVSALNI